MLLLKTVVVRSKKNVLPFAFLILNSNFSCTLEPKMSSDEAGEPKADSSITIEDSEQLENESAEICYKAKTKADCEQIDLPRLENCDDCWQQCFWQTLNKVEQENNKGCHFGEHVETCGYRSGGLSTCQGNDRTCGTVRDQEASVFVDAQGTQYVSTGRCAATKLEGVEYAGLCSWNKSGDKYFLISGEAVCRCLCES